MAETLEAMARALFKSWFVDFDPVHARAAGRRTGLPDDLAALFPDSFGDDGLPQGWATCTLGDMLELAYGKSLPSETRRQGSIAVYGSGGVAGFHDEPLVQGPGIIVERKGSVGTLHWEQDNFFPIDTVFYVRVKQTSLTYLWYLLPRLGLHQMNTDAAIPGLNRENAYRVKVILPSGSALDAFDSAVIPLDTERHALSQQCRTLAALRDTLLPKLISGELRIADAE